MQDNQKYTEIKVRIICTSCGNGCGDHLITIGDKITLCFSCIDDAKKKVDSARKEISLKQISELGVFLEKVEGGTSMYEIAEKLHDAGYRKVE